MNTESVFNLFENEENAWDEGEIPYEVYMSEVIECPCGFETSRVKMEEHWCDDLEEMLHAIHTPKG
jgi:hypothetical protein